MKYINEPFRKYLPLVIFGVGLYAALMNLSSVLVVLKSAGHIVAPFMMALVIAFIINVPMNGVAGIIRRIDRVNNLSEGKVNVISLILTLIILVGVISLVVTIVVPAFVSSLAGVIAVTEKKIPIWINELSQNGFINDTVQKIIGNFDISKIIEFINNRTKNIESLLKYAGNAISGITAFGIGLILCLYILAGKHVLGKQVLRVMYAFVPVDRVSVILKICRLTKETFAKFLRGQCLESVILGTLIFISFEIVRLPYPPVAGVLTALLAFVPFIGAFISLGVMMILTAMVSPIKVILCFVTFEAIQLIENHFIYPKVVGNSVGLPAFWTLVAVTLGGQLFGIIGMIFFIPVVSVIYTLIQDKVKQNLSNKHLEIDDITNQL